MIDVRPFSTLGGASGAGGLPPLPPRGRQCPLPRLCPLSPLCLPQLLHLLRPAGVARAVAGSCASLRNMQC